VASGKEARSAARSDFRIGSWLAQPTLNLIRDGAAVRHLEPQVMDLLVFLATTGGRVLSKDDLIDAVWEGRFIAEATLTRAIADLRRALGDDQRRPQYIETIPKRGYRLVADISEAATPKPSVVLAFTRPDSIPHDGTGQRIADRLASARRDRFVGRETEIDTFRSALLATEPAFVVWHVHGAGGVGKTTLLQEFARIADEAGRRVIRIDGRNVDSSPDGLLLALSEAVGLEHVDLAAIIQRWPAGGVLVIDTYEVLTPIDDWLRQTLLPKLPAQSLVVIAGRHEPARAWRTDVAWAALTRVAPLGNFDPSESRRYLTRCGIRTEHHDEALAFTRGHPLALSLIADVLTRGDRLAPSRLESDPEVVRLLLEAFVQDVPSRDHRLALHACATAWATTEPLLATALDRSDAHDVFEWLASLSFIEHGPYGLFPHDLARDVLSMDFRWRDPDAAFRVTERVLGFLYPRLERTQGLERQRVWFDVLFVQRYNPNIRPHYDWSGFGTAFGEVASTSDYPAIVHMVERYEGPESAAIACYWLKRQPEAFIAIRSIMGDLLGFGANLSLTSVTPEDIAADPAIATAVAFAEQHGPPRPGELMLYARFWMDAGAGQQVQTQVFTVVSVTALQSWVLPHAAWCFVATSSPDLVDPLFTEIHIWRARDADFEVGGRRYGVFAHDWRVEPADAWLRLKAERASRITALPTV
jgi:DNA-binding winged helix-turn-helix (wHTH) protein